MTYHGRGAANFKWAEERKRKREEYRASDAAKKTRVDERVGERVVSKAAGGSGSQSTSLSKTAGPSGPFKSKPKPKTSKGTEAMNDDRDAKGETEKEEFQLIDYETVGEEVGMSKAEGKQHAGSKRA
ncbi:hypothetical protein L227DRAFT_615263 [Lentinus tigrinus ALCF2SS1-6]|uniref:Uncharacterized protein n=1 Tax=Lentinus tigrinus ALCF2SS1-6 TaxID=1328759 RepID=A0A5C2RVB9_9APHY|nr:hypothetical protein L227DRAFT_615263 [Lentinus tigrinus ALCF2SS1-6]